MILENIPIITPKSQRTAITLGELHERIGETRSVAINFVPGMLSALAFDAALNIYDTARDLRVHEVKEQCKQIRSVVRGIGRALSTAMGDEVAESYNYLCRCYDQETTTDQWLMLTNLTTEAQNQGCPYPEISARIAVVRLITDEIKAFRYGMMNGYLEYSHNDMQLAVLYALGRILEVADTMPESYKMELPERMKLTGAVLRNRAWHLAEKAMGDELSEADGTKQVRLSGFSRRFARKLKTI